MVRITYFRKKCIGCNACVEAAPYRWRVSTRDGRCSLIGGKEKSSSAKSSKGKEGVYRAIVGEEEYEANLMAAANCPVKIIRVEVL
jgi:ferredoxin